MFPAVEEHNFLTLPSDDEAEQAASKTFARIMHLEKPLSTKTNRDLIAVISNYISPSAIGRITTRTEFAKQFSHSQNVHNTFYSSEVFERSNDGTMIRSDIMVAREFHSNFGEQPTSFLSNRDGVDTGKTLDNEILTVAAQHAYRTPTAIPTSIQSEVILRIDSKNKIVSE